MISAPLAAAVDSGEFDLVVTSGRRLSRAIDRHVATCALARGETAWVGPRAMPWPAWLRELARARLVGDGDAAAAGRLLPAAAASALWRDAARNAMPAEAGFVLGMARLGGLAADAHALMCRYQLSLDAVADEAFDDDARFFVDCARRVSGRLENGGWLLEAELAGSLAESANLVMPHLERRILLAGFEQLTPDQQTLIDALGRERFETVDTPGPAGSVTRLRYATFRDEVVAAGRWAREQRERAPDRRVAVVVPGLAGIAADARRWFRQGFLPPAAATGAGFSADEGFEVSYGRAVAQYPAITTALALIDFALRPQAFTELSRLLRSPVINQACDPAALALERRLRERPDQYWDASTLQDFAGPDGPVWLEPVVALAADADASRTPSAWAETLAGMLDAAGWLGGVATDSPVYQLLRAFRTALNGLGTLDTTHPALRLHDAVTALRGILDDTVFQPEGTGADVLVCGPLEMSGLGFDAVWLCGLDASRWPAPGRPDPLLPRRLQRERNLPDATPAQTEAFWRQRFDALLASAPEVVVSRAEREGDSALLASPLLDVLDVPEADDGPDGRLGWCELAGTLQASRSPESLSRFDPSRRLFRAATALPLLASDPFAAIALGRWNVDALEDPQREIGPRLRGTLIHAALQRIYNALGGSASLASQPTEARAQLVRKHLADVMAREFVHADAVVRALLRAEEARSAELIDTIVAADAGREPFEVVATEQARMLVLAGLTLHLRVDRVDRTAHGDLIIDYKTGANLRVTRDSVEGEHFQLLLYALSNEAPLVGVALAGLNRDTHRYNALLATHARSVLMDTERVQNVDIGRCLEDWHGLAEGLAARFLMAPVDIARHSQQPALDWLSRVSEERRDDG